MLGGLLSRVLGVGTVEPLVIQASLLYYMLSMVQQYFLKQMAEVGEEEGYLMVKPPGEQVGLGVLFLFQQEITVHQAHQIVVSCILLLVEIAGGLI